MQKSISKAKKKKKKTKTESATVVEAAMERKLKSLHKDILFIHKHATKSARVFCMSVKSILFSLLFFVECKTK